MRAGIARTVWCALLATLLLAIQQVGFAHALTHFANPASKSGPRNDAPPPAEKVCIECLVFAQLATGLTAHAPPVLPPVAVVPVAAIPLASRQALFSPHYHSRAPPAPA